MANAADNDKVMYLLAYLIPIVSALAVYFLNANKNKDLRFHSLQALIYWVAAAVVLSVVFNLVLGNLLFYSLSLWLLLAWLVPLLWLLAWLYALYIGFKAMKGESISIPFIGDIAKSV